MEVNTIINGDFLSVAPQIPDESIQCCITSPPYWGLRDYGLEPVAWSGDPEYCEMAEKRLGEFFL